MPTFFIDRCLDSKTIVAGLRAADLDIVTMRDVYVDRAPSVKDVEWLALCGEKKWAVLTKDSRILRNK
ncbi:MAG: hypothetical protein SPI12_05865 [Actinomycetaceae bacterium]|nr:hypothetical protein [Actinomycetaceae bacterium]MDY6083364.1 hypothetical protein [Actinomycetaceae bacterium]